MTIHKSSYQSLTKQQFFFFFQPLPVSPSVSFINLQDRNFIPSGFGVVQHVNNPVFRVHQMEWPLCILVAVVKNNHTYKYSMQKKEIEKKVGF